MLTHQEPMEAAKARLLNPLQLAYMGDTVWELMVRAFLMETGHNVHKLHKLATGQVNAGAQAQAAARLAPYLTAEEQELVRRGRNAHARHSAPRNQNPADYSSATGLETLMGFLYLTGQAERLRELFRLSRETEP